MARCVMSFQLTVIRNIPSSPFMFPVPSQARHRATEERRRRRRQPRLSKVLLSYDIVAVGQ